MSTLSNPRHAQQLFSVDDALLSISSASRGQLVKMLITLEPHVYLDQILHAYLFYLCPATGMQNGDEALPSIISAR